MAESVEACIQMIVFKKMLQSISFKYRRETCQDDVGDEAAKDLYGSNVKFYRYCVTRR